MELMNNPMFEAIAKRYINLFREMMNRATSEQVVNGVPSPAFALEIYNTLMMEFHRELTRAVIVRLAAGGTVRDGVRNAAKDMDVVLNEQVEAVLIDLLEKQYGDEKRKKDEKIEVVVDDSFFRGK